MAQKQIKQLNEYTSPTSSDLYMVQKASDDETVKVTGTNLIPASSVSTAKIAADAVTDAKLVYGKVRARQGGSATSWITAGTTTYDYSGTNTFIQVGSISADATPKTVTFPVAFNQIPLVFLTVLTGAGANTFARLGNDTTTTTCAITVVTDGGLANTGQVVQWMAIGE